jgi:putative integral membrane protein (TIGR02587 family)
LARPAARPSIQESLREYGRGLAGGLLFSLPLVYTMEVWWLGFIAHPERLLAYVAFIFLLLLGYNRFAGIRHDANWAEVVIDSVEELGLGVVTGGVLLFVLGRITANDSFDEALGKVVMEAGIVAIGFSVGTAQLGATRHEELGEGPRGRRDRGPMPQIILAFCGAVLFAANVAPTEEVLMIAVETSPWRLLAVAALSLAVASVILYFTDFARAQSFVLRRSGHDVLVGSFVTYGIALVASGAILWFFGRFDMHSVDICVRQTVVLGLPGALGASAGRLLLQS